MTAKKRKNWTWTLTCILFCCFSYNSIYSFILCIQYSNCLRKMVLCTRYTQQVHNVKMTLFQRRCDVITSHRRWYDVILTLCAHWVCTHTFNIIFLHLKYDLLLPELCLLSNFKQYFLYYTLVTSFVKKVWVDEIRLFFIVTFNSNNLTVPNIQFVLRNKIQSKTFDCWIYSIELYVRERERERETERERERDRQREILIFL